MNLEQEKLYYRECADYDGVVARAQQELQGITVLNYLKLYTKRSWQYYTAINNALRSAFLKHFPSGSDDRKHRWTALGNRRQSRLYRRRMMARVNLEMERTYASCNKAEEIVQKQKSLNDIDQKLSLARRLQTEAFIICQEASVLRSIRAGFHIVGIGVLKASFCPSDTTSVHGAKMTAIRVWKIKNFRTLLTQFDALLNKGEEKLSDTASVSDECPDNKRLSLRQVALLHIYQKKPAIKDDTRATDLAERYGHASGQALYKRYRSVINTSDRVGVEDKAVAGMAKDIEAILHLLTGPGLQQAECELNTIRAKIT
jgi:hypothetical protein